MYVFIIRHDYTNFKTKTNECNGPLCSTNQPGNDVSSEISTSGLRFGGSRTPAMLMCCFIKLRIFGNKFT